MTNILQAVGSIGTFIMAMLYLIFGNGTNQTN